MGAVTIGRPKAPERLPAPVRDGRLLKLLTKTGGKAPIPESITLLASKRGGSRPSLNAETQAEMLLKELRRAGFV